MEIQNYYKLLQLSKESSCETLYEQCRDLFIKYHPQNNRTKESLKKFILVNDAYAVLLKEEIRKDYDLLLSEFSVDNPLIVDKEVSDRIKYFITEKRKEVRKMLYGEEEKTILDEEPIFFTKLSRKFNGEDENELSGLDMDIDLNPFD